MADDGRKLLLLIDDCSLRRAGFAALLEAWAVDNALELAAVAHAEAGDFLDHASLLVASCGAMPIDEALTPLSADIVEHGRPLPLIVVSDRHHIADVALAFRLGVQGYLSSLMTPEAAFKVLSFVMRGGRYFPPEILTEAASRETTAGAAGGGGRRDQPGHFMPHAAEDPRGIEAQVLALLRTGQSNADIARELCQPENRIKQVVRRIMKSLGVSNRTQIALWASQES